MRDLSSASPADFLLLLGSLQDLPLQLGERFEVAFFLSQLALVGIDVDHV
jgi:hypothetical protein